MKNLLKKIFPTSFKPVPENVKEALLLRFPQALNIEWEIKKGLYEAVFYVDEIEFIAKISEENGVLEHKQNLKPDELPAHIAKVCKRSGEIMNGIAISKGTAIFYEVIVRDKNLDRSLILLDESGNLLENRVL